MSRLILEHTGSGSGKRYTIASKIKVAEAVIAGASMTSMITQTGVAWPTIRDWVTDHKAGKFSLDNTSSIIRKPKTQIQVLIERYDAKALADREELIQALQVLERVGIRVA